MWIGAAWSYGRRRTIPGSSETREGSSALEDFTVAMRPVYAEGSRAGHLVGLDRGGAIALATRLPVGLSATGGWAETTIDLGEEPMRDELTGRDYSGRVPLASVFETYPVALLAVAR